jgi:serine/threonine protein kinase
VSVDSVRADLASRGRWLKPEDIHYDYTPGGEIGKGAMGMIYKAEYVTSHGRRTVAVKHMHKGGDFSESELLEAALHEMIMGYKIKAHENIVEFVGAAQHNAFGLVLVYELIDGINLEDFFHAQKSKKASWKPKFKYSLKWGEQAPKKHSEKSGR